MWEQTKEWVEKHPYLTGSLALALILLFWLMRRSSSTAQTQQVVSTGPSESLQALELQAGTQVQTAQLQAQTQVAAYNAALNATQLTTAAQTTQDQLAAQVQLQSILSGADVANFQTGGALALGLAQLGYQSPLLPISTIGGGGSGAGSGAGTGTTVVPSQPTSIGLPVSSTPVTPITPANVDTLGDYGYAYAQALGPSPCQPGDESCISSRDSQVNDFNNEWMACNGSHGTPPAWCQQALPGAYPWPSTPAAPSSPSTPVTPESLGLSFQTIPGISTPMYLPTGAGILFPPQANADVGTTVNTGTGY